MKKLTQLLKAYGLNSDMQYFEMIAESFINGQRSQAIEQFKELPRQSRKDMIRAVTEWGHLFPGLTERDRAALIQAV